MPMAVVAETCFGGIVLNRAVLEGTGGHRLGRFMTNGNAPLRVGSAAGLSRYFAVGNRQPNSRIPAPNSASSEAILARRQGPPHLGLDVAHLRLYPARTVRLTSHSQSQRRRGSLSSAPPTSAVGLAEPHHRPTTSPIAKRPLSTPNVVPSRMSDTSPHLYSRPAFAQAIHQPSPREGPAAPP